MQRFHDLFISIHCSTGFRRFLCPSSGAQNCTYIVRYCQFIEIYRNKQIEKMLHLVGCTLERYIYLCACHESLQGWEVQLHGSLTLALDAGCFYNINHLRLTMKGLTEVCALQYTPCQGSFNFNTSAQRQPTGQKMVTYLPVVACFKKFPSRSQQIHTPTTYTQLVLRS